MSLLADNLTWLGQNVPALAAWLGTADEAVEISAADAAGNRSLHVAGERWLEALDQQLAASVAVQCRDQVDSVLTARAVNPTTLEAGSGELLARLVDQHRPMLIEALPNLAANSALSAPEGGCLRNAMVLGSLALLPLAHLLLEPQPFPWLSLVLVDDDPRQLAALLHLLDLPRFVQTCKQRGVGLSLICEADSDLLQGRLVDHFALLNPCALYGLQVIRSPQRSPLLMELHSWVHAPEGLTQHVVGMLGFATDELNQTQQALWSALANRPARQLRPDVWPADQPAVLVASGPSLDAQLPWLKEHQHQLLIVAAGSALGSLMRAGIRPAMAVYLERDTGVFRDLCDLAAEGYDFSDMILGASSTLDPRIPGLFGQTIFFHRPSAAASRLFPDEAMATLPQAGPHVVNASLELLLMLGARRLVLVGCDFGAAPGALDRSKGALGYSNRQLSLPTAGSAGRTVFSEPELMHAHFAFQRMLWFASGLEVRRLGEGVALPEARSCSADAELAAWAAADPSLAAEFCSHLPEAPLHGEGYGQLLSNHAVAVDQLLDQVVSQLRDAERWDNALSVALGGAFSRFTLQSEESNRYARAMLAQPLFFLLRPLHDAPDRQWSVQVDLALQSLQVLRGVFRAHAALLNQFLQLRRMPSWDPDWIRARCRQLDLINSAS